MTDNPDNGARALLDQNQINDPELCEVYDYWLSKKGDDLFPSTDKIDILDFPKGARFWAIMDVANDAEDYVFRFVGSDFVEFVSLEPTGRSLSDISNQDEFAPFMADLRETLAAVMKSQRPVINGPYKASLRRRYDSHTMTCINLPLSRDGKSISQILKAVAVSPQQ